MSRHTLVKETITRKIRSNVPRKPNRPTEEVIVERYDKLEGKERKEQKKTEAKARQTNRDKLSHNQQLQILDKKLGINKGAKKERARLLKLIEESKNAKPSEQDKNKTISSNKKNNAKGPRNQKIKHRRNRV